MKQFCVRFPLLAAVLLGASSPETKSQETNSNSVAPPQSVSASGLVAEALARNPELKFYEGEIAAAKAGHRTARSFSNPEVAGSVGQKRTSTPGLSDEGTAWSVSVRQSFEWPGRMGLRKAIANRDIELAELGYERFKSALANRTRTLAYSLLAAQEDSKAAAEVATRFRELREILVQRDPAGLTPLLEIRVIEATEVNAQRKASEAGLRLQIALFELNQLRGAAPDASVTMDSSPLEFGTLADRSTLLAATMTNNFELRLRSVELAQQGLRVDLAKNERFPSIAIGPEYSEEKVGADREQILGLSVSLPLPLWDRNGGKISAARARKMQAEVSFQVAQREIQRQVLTAATTFETKRREMSRWRPDAVQHFKDAAELADRHYRLGAVPISTYVELQQQYLDAVETLLTTKQEALEAAAQLELLTGLPLPLANASSNEEKK